MPPVGLGRPGMPEVFPPPYHNGWGSDYAYPPYVASGGVFPPGQGYPPVGFPPGGETMRNPPIPEGKPDSAPTKNTLGASSSKPGAKTGTGVKNGAKNGDKNTSSSAASAYAQDGLAWDSIDDLSASVPAEANRGNPGDFRASRSMRGQPYPNPNPLMVRQGRAHGRPRLTLEFPWYFELIAIVITMLTISSLVRTFLLQPFYIPSRSMQDTLMINDSVLVTKTAPRYSKLNRGDIIVFRDTENWLQSDREGVVKKKQPNPVFAGIKRFLIFVGLAPEDSDGFLIKRIIGMGADNVACCDEDGMMSINGKSIDEDYIPKTGQASEVKFSVVVPKGSLWVMGDNRNHSADSRYHMDSPSGGFVSEKQVVGRAFVVVWPLNHMRFISPSCAFYNIPRPAMGDNDNFNSESDETPERN